MAQLRPVADALVTTGEVLAGAARAQVEVLLTLPATAVAVLRGLRTLAEGADDAREAAARVNRVAGRLEALLDEVEEPLQTASPGLRRISKVLSDPAIGGIPDTLRGLKETQERVAAIAASTERITSFVDDAGSRIGSLPGLLRRPFRLPETPPVLPPAAPLPPDLD